jgi:hypothetical protein
MTQMAEKLERLQRGIDAMARQGLQPDAYCPAPSGNPSRASLVPRMRDEQ